MSKYKKTMSAGRWRYEYTYSRTTRSDSPKARGQKQHHSSMAQKELNRKLSFLQLTGIVAANYADSPTAMFVTVDFDPEHYPAEKKKSEIRAYCEQQAENYLARLSYLVKKRGGKVKPLWAIGIGEEGRFHLHFLLDGVTWEDCAACWKRGGCDFHYLYSDEEWLKARDWANADGSVNPEQLAAYLMKNGNERPVGKHPWHAGRCLIRPELSPARTVPDSEPIDPEEQDAIILTKHSDSLMFSEYCSISYLLPVQYRGGPVLARGGVLYSPGKRRK